MDGPDHYKEAEKSFMKAKNAAAQADAASAVLFMQAAQFHATMALAAATADTIPHTWRQEWVSVFYEDDK